MRMTADSKLPTASYQIKMQRILNEYFFGLTFLVLESLLVYELHEWGFGYVRWVDGLAALTVFSHNVLTLVTYYLDAHRAREHITPTTKQQQQQQQKQQQPLRPGSTILRCLRRITDDLDLIATVADDGWTDGIHVILCSSADVRSLILWLHFCCISIVYFLSSLFVESTNMSVLVMLLPLSTHIV